MTTSGVSKQNVQLYFFLGLLTITAVLAFFIFRPYLGAMILAATIGVIFRPVHRKLLGVFGEWGSLAAFATTILIFLIIFIPLILFTWQIFVQAINVYNDINDDSVPLTEAVSAYLNERVTTIVPGLSLNITDSVRQVVAWLLEHVGSLFSSATRVIVNLFLSLLTLYYVFKDGPRLLQKITALSPLQDHYDKAIVERLRLAVNSVIRGSMVVAIIQGLATGVGLFLFGVPNAVLWGSITVIAAFVPTLGTALVLIPALAYLFLTNQFMAGVGLALWGMLAVGFIDNLLGPKLIGRGIQIHPLLILLAVIGGIALFGPIGFVVGPLVLSFLIALLDIYPLVVLRLQ